MTAEFPALAAQNATLLRAIAQGPAASLTELADRAALGVGNMNRKLQSLAEAGLVASTGEASHQVVLTDAARLALDAIAVYEAGGLAAMGAGPTAVRPDLIDANPWDPRKVATTEQDEQLAVSIAEKGVLQPIIVRAHPDPTSGGRWQQALGHRRVRAARLAIAKGWVSADFAVPIDVRALTDEDMEEIAIVENVQRADLHWLDEAEGYGRLAARGKSAAEIIRLVGDGARKKRSIQELTQLATGLDEDTKRRARLPEGEPDHLTKEQCRFMVGNRKPKPSLDLPPRMALALVELLDAGEAEPDSTDNVEVRLYRRPTGGQLIALSDRQLIRFRFEGQTPIATVIWSEPLAKWLADIGFHEDREACLMALRTPITGDLAAGALASTGAHWLGELQPPEPEAGQAASEAEAEAEGDDANRAADNAQDETPDFLRRLAGATAREAPPSEAIELEPRHQLAVLEIAHKAQREGIDRPTGRAVAIGEHHKDPLANELVFARLVMFMPSGTQTLATLTPRARAWLDGQGLADISDDQLVAAAQRLDYADATQATPYATDWLNVAPPAPRTPAPPAEDSDEPRMTPEGMARVVEAHQAANPPPAAPDPAAMESALRRLAAAAREARALIGRARTVKLKAADIDPVEKLLDTVLADADRVLKQAE